MAKLTRGIIERRYAPEKRENSVYPDQGNIGREMAEERSEQFKPNIFYYVDKQSGALKMKKITRNKNTKLEEET